MAKRAPELAQYTRLLVHETDRIHNLLERIRGQSLSQTAALNIHQALDQAMAVVGAQFPDCQIVRDYDPSLPEIQGDLAALTQLALNLLLNAAQAQASQIQVRTRAEHQVHVRARQSSLEPRFEPPILHGGSLVRQKSKVDLRFLADF